jgi:hypothetical protein
MFLACSKGPCNFFIKLLEKNMFLACLKDRMHELQGVGLMVGLPSTLSLFLKVLSSKPMKAISWSYRTGGSPLELTVVHLREIPYRRPVHL